MQDLVQQFATLEQWQASVRGVDTTQLEDFFQPGVLPRFLGGLLAVLIAEPEQISFLDALPSEASPGERRFLRNFMAEFWSGQRHVLEIGPFLGSTSRALASGMLANSRRDPNARLLTFDKFDRYYSAGMLLDFLEPLFSDGTLEKSLRESIRGNQDFLEVYRQIHAPHPYAKLILAFRRPVPDTPEQASESGDWFNLEPGTPVDVFFIDGCKSWYGTKHFMRSIADSAETGSYFIFQDFGARTCFWLTSFLYMFADRFKLIAHIDHTYTYRLEVPFSPEEIEQAFPDTPSGFTSQHYERMYNVMRADAFKRSDVYGGFVLALHHAGALAYLGDKEAARRRILELAAEPAYTEAGAGPAGNFGSYIQQALKSPTYTPDGEIFL